MPFLLAMPSSTPRFARIRAQRGRFYADPRRTKPGEINHLYGGGGVYFDDPRGHLMEIITHPYGDRPQQVEMPFIASNGLTETGTSKTATAAGMNVHYHEAGTGEPVLFLHSYGPGTLPGSRFTRRSASCLDITAAS
jgi:hypothetical protein